MTGEVAHPTQRLGLRAWWLGQVPYERAMDFQRRLQQDVLARRGHPGYLLLLEHPSVITAGRSADLEDLRASPAQLARLGVGFFASNRGGRLTYHGPGQLVGYPVLDLKAYGCDVHRYMRQLEEVLIRLLRGLGVEARRRAGHTGVWVGERKVASIGVAIRRWVTAHGFALNVAPEMNHFSLIRPCGLPPETIVSLAELLPEVPQLDRLARWVAETFAEVFGLGPTQVLFENRPVEALCVAGAR